MIDGIEVQEFTFPPSPELQVTQICEELSCARTLVRDPLNDTVIRAEVVVNVRVCPADTVETTSGGHETPSATTTEDEGWAPCSNESCPETFVQYGHDQAYGSYIEITNPSSDPSERRVVVALAAPDGKPALLLCPHPESDFSYSIIECRPSRGGIFWTERTIYPTGDQAETTFSPSAEQYAPNGQMFGPANADYVYALTTGEDGITECTCYQMTSIDDARERYRFTVPFGQCDSHSQLACLETMAQIILNPDADFTHIARSVCPVTFTSGESRQSTAKLAAIPLSTPPGESL